MAIPNSNFTALLTSTLNNHSKTLVDTITQGSELLDWLKGAGRIKPFAGGLKMVEPLKYVLNSVQSFSGYDVLDATPFDGVTAAEYTMKDAAVPITISDDEKDLNNGKEAILSLIDTRVEIATDSMSEGMETMLFGDGLGSAGKDMLGLQALVEVDTGVTSYVATLGGSSTVGGITRSTANAFWQNYVSKGTYTSATGDKLIPSLQSMYYALLRGGDQPDAIFTTKTVLAMYETLLWAKQEWVGNDKADAKFMRLTYAGIPIRTSHACPAGYAYMLNSKYLKFRPHTNWNFKTLPFVRPPRQMANVSFIVAKGNLTLSNSNRQGVIYGIT